MGKDNNIRVNIKIQDNIIHFTTYIIHLYTSIE